MPQNEHGNFRGLHIVVVNPFDYKIESAKVFDTYKSSVELEKFIEKAIPTGHIVVAACKDDCAKGLSWSGRKWFINMGSKEIVKLKYREGFVFIGKIGDKIPNEKRSLNQEDDVSVAQVFDVTMNVPSS